MIAGLEEISAGHHQHRRQGRQRRPPEGPRHRDGLPELRALSAHDGLREPRVRTEAPEVSARRRSTTRVQDAAKILGIDAYLDRKPKALSGGQRQRVALGRAIVRQPKVFLFDEPLSNLDANLRVQMRTEISRLHHRLQTTMIYVTHDQIEAMSMGDRIVVMNDGVVQQVDTPLEHLPPPGKQVRRRVHRQPDDELSVRDRPRERNCAVRTGRLSAQHSAPGLRTRIDSKARRSVIMGIRPEHIFTQQQDGGRASGQHHREHRGRRTRRQSRSSSTSRPGRHAVRGALRRGPSAGGRPLVHAAGRHDQASLLRPGDREVALNVVRNATRHD